MRILVVFWHPDPERIRLAVRQHLHALEAGPMRHQILYWNAFYGIPSWRKLVGPQLDAVLLHTTLLCNRWNEPGYFQALKEKLGWVRELDCPKVALPQDEYDHADILDEWLHELGVTVVFSNFDEPTRNLLYSRMTGKTAFHQCLTGYIEEATARSCEAWVPPITARPNDIVYRATRLPYWFGSHGQLKSRLAEVFQERARARGLVTDISIREEDIIVGERWLNFLGSGKAVIGCESGSSVLDRRGALMARVQDLCRTHPGISFQEVNRRMPEGWDRYEFFALSPRHLEAVITKTCQILVEGRYAGVLEPHTHYIPVKRDLSNVDDALDQLQDLERIQGMAERAYRDIWLNGRHTYRRFAEEVEQAIIRWRTEAGLAGQPAVSVSNRITWEIGSEASRLWAGGQRLRRWAAPTIAHLRRYWSLTRDLGGRRKMAVSSSGIS